MTQNPTALLFTPATRPDRFDKALSCGATLVIDLEDSVHPNDKARARQIIFDFDKQGRPYWVRINTPSNTTGDDHTKDLAVLEQCQHLKGVLIPKIHSNQTIAHTHQALGVPVIAIIETAYAMANVSTLAQSSGLFALSFGRLDLASELKVADDTAGAAVLFDRLRCDMVLHSALNALARPIETIFTNFLDTCGLIETATHAYQMGFGGQLCIHPNQVATVKACYLPSSQKIAFAQKILAHADKTGDVVFAIDGTMVDLPLIHWAKNSLKNLSTP